MVIVQHKGDAGLLAGIFGCVFGLLGIFTFGIIFVPLAALCGVIGVIRGIAGGSASGIGSSVLAAALAVWGFVVSPSLWLLLGMGIIASHVSPEQSTAAPVGAPTLHSAPSAFIRPPHRTADESAQNRLLFTRLNQVLDIMPKIGPDITSRIHQLDDIQQKYRDVTVAMQDDLQKEQGIYYMNRGLAIGARARISSSMIQSRSQEINLHGQVINRGSRFRDWSRNFLKALSGLTQSCSGNVNRHTLFRDTDEIVSRCRQVLSESTGVEQYIQDDLAAYARETRVWQEERAKQDRIIQAAEVSIRY